MEKWKAAQKACEAGARSVGTQVVNWARRSALLMVAEMAVLLGAGRAACWVGNQVAGMVSRLEQWLDKTWDLQKDSVMVASSAVKSAEELGGLKVGMWDCH